MIDYTKAFAEVFRKAFERNVTQKNALLERLLWQQIMSEARASCRLIDEVAGQVKR